MEKIMTPVNQIARLLVRLTIVAILLASATTYTSGSLVVSAKKGSTLKNSTKDPYSGSGKLILKDSLKDNSHGWQIDPPPNGCQFTNGAYHVTALEEPEGTYKPCDYNLPMSNFTFEVQMRITKGTCAGIVLRRTMSLAHVYGFRICLSSGYGVFRIDKFKPHGSTMLSEGPPSTAIHSGLNQTNLMAAVVNGSTFDFYINHQKITSLQDSKYSQGQLGVFAYEGEAVFTNARVWQL